MSIRKFWLSLSLAIYVLHSTACGVLLYPERQGQKGGRIDPAIAILDGIGLLLFLIPGLVALAKGKKLHDKRDTEKERDWNREKQRAMSHPAP